MSPRRRVAALGVHTVFDLRTEMERAAQPDRLREGTAHVVVDVLADAPTDGRNSYSPKVTAT
ncbi:tyrosine-protein phosphatase [Rhodococcus pyridinivorans]|uniref:tyrosine-protein phosphatase n=1 Tax=Rhodococcus pyridinivorans TaxID=103816 RepID=UPI001C550657|nr:tyrosine-protein phosphatase [Rhodococcus pyridinivorans]